MVTDLCISNGMTLTMVFIQQIHVRVLDFVAAGGGGYVIHKHILFKYLSLADICHLLN